VTEHASVPHTVVTGKLQPSATWGLALHYADAQHKWWHAWCQREEKRNPPNGTTCAMHTLALFHIVV